MKNNAAIKIGLFAIGVIGGRLYSGRKVKKLEKEFENELKTKDELIEKSLKQTEEACELAKRIKEANEGFEEAVSNLYSYEE